MLSPHPLSDFPRLSARSSCSPSLFLPLIGPRNCFPIFLIIPLIPLQNCFCPRSFVCSCPWNVWLRREKVEARRLKWLGDALDLLEGLYTFQNSMSWLIFLFLGSLSFPDTSRQVYYASLGTSLVKLSPPALSLYSIITTRLTPPLSPGLPPYLLPLSFLYILTGSDIEMLLAGLFASARFRKSKLMNIDRGSDAKMPISLKQ